MKKMYATLTLHDGSTKEIYVHVDEQTAAMLEQLEDKEFVNQYLIDEFKIKMDDCAYHRHIFSFEKAKEKGFDLVADTDLLEEAIKKEDAEVIHNAINQLEPQQQWLVEQIYFNGRKQIEIAEKLGVGETAISNRMTRIFEKLKKILN